MKAAEPDADAEGEDSEGGHGAVAEDDPLY